MFKDIAERKQSFKKSKSKFGRKPGGGKYGKRLSKVLFSINKRFCFSGPGCSKLTTSLVNVSLNFQKLNSLIWQYFLLK